MKNLIVNRAVLIYTVIANRETILAQYSHYAGTFKHIAQRILHNIDSSAEKYLCYKYEDYLFYCITDGTVHYLCTTTSDFSHELAYSYLTEIKNRFVMLFIEDAIHSALNCEMDKVFAPYIRQKMKLYMGYETTKTKPQNILTPEIESANSTPINITSVIKRRGDSIKLLAEPFENDFNDPLIQRSRKPVVTKIKAYRLKHPRLFALLAFCILLAIIYLALAGICGWDFHTTNSEGKFKCLGWFK